MHTKRPAIPRFHNTRLGAGSHASIDTGVCRGGWRVLETVGVSCVLSVLGAWCLSCGRPAAVCALPTVRGCPSHLIGGPIQRSEKQASVCPARSWAPVISRVHTVPDSAPLITPTGQTQLNPTQTVPFTAAQSNPRKAHHTHILACGGLNGELPSLHDPTSPPGHHNTNPDPSIVLHLHAQPIPGLSEFLNPDSPSKCARRPFAVLTLVSERLPFDSSHPPHSPHGLPFRS